MAYKILVVILNAAILALAGCGDSGCAGSGGRRASAPTAEQIAGLTVTGVYDEPVTLVGGRYEGQPFVAGGASRPTLAWVRDLYVTGDLTGDGNEDAAILLTESSGGSGTWLYVAAVSIREGRAVNVGTARVGDRPQIRAMTIDSGRVWLDLVEQGPGDAACCPTQLAHRGWELRDGALIEAVTDTTGTLSLDILMGREWVLTHLNLDEPAPAEPEITISFEDGKISGSSGCNGYFASIDETSPGNLRVGPVATTRKSCPEEIEKIEYFYQLRAARINSYGFLMGQLAVSWRSPDGWHGTMLFAPRLPTHAAQ